MADKRWLCLTSAPASLSSTNSKSARKCTQVKRFIFRTRCVSLPTSTHPQLVRGQESLFIFTTQLMHTNMEKFEIWVEGYSATGQWAGAELLNNGSGKPGPIWANSFDEAVEKYMDLYPEHGIEPNLRSRYVSDKAFNNRKSNWNIWLCDLYPTEKAARKSFG